MDDIMSYVETASRERLLDYAELIDVRAVRPPWFSSSDVWQVAGLVRNFKTGETFGPRAVVVGNDLIYGMVRMFANLVQDFAPMNVFHDPVQAEAWLGDWQAGGG